MMTSAPQNVLNSPYKRKRFKKLIPELITKDFDIPFTSYVRNGVLNVHIIQGKGRKHFSFSVSKSNKDKQKGITYKISYHTTNNSFTDYGGSDIFNNTVTDTYKWIKEQMIADGLLTKEELMIQDIIE